MLPMCGWRWPGPSMCQPHRRSERPEPVAAVPQLQVWQRPIPAAIGVLVLIVVSALLAWSLGRPAPTTTGIVTRFPFILPEGDVIDLSHGIALSPDGRTLVYAGERDGVQQLFVRTRDQMSVRVLPGTEAAVHPFFSPDGAWVGFFTTDALKKVALAGGPPVMLCAVGRHAAADLSRHLRVPAVRCLVAEGRAGFR